MKRGFMLIALVLVAGCGGGGGDDKSSSSSDQSKTETTRVEVIQASGDGGFDPKAIYKSDSPSVVTVVSLFGSGGLDSLLDGSGGNDQGANAHG